MNNIMGMLSALLAVAAVANAGTHEWYSDGDLGDATDAELKQITGRGATLYDMVALYKATEARTSGTWYQNIVIRDDFSIVGEGDTLVAQSEIENQGGWKYFEEFGTNSVVLEDGCHYYTVLFDRPVTNLTAGDWSIVLDKKTFLATTNNDDLLVFEEDKNAGIQWNLVQPTAHVSDISVVGSDVHLEWTGGALSTNTVEYKESLADTNETWKILFSATVRGVTNYVHAGGNTNSTGFYRIHSVPRVRSGF